MYYFCLLSGLLIYYGIVLSVLFIAFFNLKYYYETSADISVSFGISFFLITSLHQ